MQKKDPSARFHCCDEWVRLRFGAARMCECLFCHFNLENMGCSVSNEANSGKSKGLNVKPAIKTYY